MMQALRADTCQNRHGGDPVISQGSSLDRITIRDWQGSAGNHLGIVLDDTPAPTTPQSGARFYIGDQRAKLIGIETRLDLGPASARYNIDAWSETTWAADGTLVGGVGQTGFADVIDASAAGANGAVIHGWGGNDALAGSSGRDDIIGDDGDDLIGGGVGSDTLRGGAGKDVILSATGLSTQQRLSPTEQWTPPPGTTAWVSAPNWGVYAASPDHYTVYGGGPVSPVDDAPDVVDGGAGDDHITGGLGGDRLMGGAGNDALWGQGGADILDGGEGDDGLQGDGVKAAGYYETVAEAQHGADFIDGGAGNDVAWGQGQNDQLYGGAGNDKLWGDDTEANLGGEFHGDDYLDGEAGKDLLVGGGKDDVLYGGADNDNLWGDDTEARLGGAGDDTYALSAAWGKDLIADSDGLDQVRDSASGYKAVIVKGTDTANTIRDFDLARAQGSDAKLRNIEKWNWVRMHRLDETFFAANEGSFICAA